MMTHGENVVQWVCHHHGGGSYRNAVGLGWVRDERLVVGVVVENWTGRNAMLHIHTEEPPTRTFWDSLFAYLFDQLKCHRVTAVIPETNRDCVRLVRGLQFKAEAALTQAARDGSDLLVYVLWAKNRRYFLRKDTK
jgi:hypothetical protein